MPPDAGKAVTLTYRERTLIADALKLRAHLLARDPYVQGLRPCAALAEIEGCRELAEAIRPVCQDVRVWP